MKETMKRGDMEKYIFLAVAAILLIVSYFIIRPFFVAVISAFVLAFLIKPVHNRLSRKMNTKLAAAICIVLLILVIVIPFGLIGGGLVGELYKYTSGTSFLEFLDTLFKKVGLEINSSTVDAWGKRGLDFLLTLVNPLVTNLISFVIQLFVMFFGLYYILTNWDYLSHELENYIPFRDRKSISKELSNSTREIVYGTLLVGLAEFFVALIGFYLLGVESALLMASLIFLSVFIPAFGPAMVWVPLGVYYIFIDRTGTAIGIFIVGLIISFLIDNIFRNVVTGRKSKINPFIMLLGVFGGVALFGLFGFIIGPLVLVYAIKFIQEALKKAD